MTVKQLYLSWIRDAESKGVADREIEEITSMPRFTLVPKAEPAEQPNRPEGGK